MNDVTRAAVATVDEQRSARGLATRRVAVVSGLVNALMSVAQVVTGLLAGSAALVADGVHSASDLLSDVLVWFAARSAGLRLVPRLAPKFSPLPSYY